MGSASYGLYPLVVSELVMAKVNFPLSGFNPQKLTLIGDFSPYRFHLVCRSLMVIYANGS